MLGGGCWACFRSGPISVGGGVGAAKGLLPCFLVPKGNQPTACTLALWWLKFGPTEGPGGGGGAGAHHSVRFHRLFWVATAGSDRYSCWYLACSFSYAASARMIMLLPLSTRVRPK